MARGWESKSVEAQIDMAANVSGYEFIDGGINGRILPADAGARQNAANEKTLEIPRERRGGRCG